MRCGGIGDVNEAGWGVLSAPHLCHSKCSSFLIFKSFFSMSLFLCGPGQHNQIYIILIKIGSQKILPSNKRKSKIMSLVALVNLM